jgi:ABC-type glycerol-3-phosphate transport system substrate-binding protein
MKSTKLFAVALGAIALFPAASFAENVKGTSQEANIKTTTVGSGNVNVQEVLQRSIDFQNANTPGSNINGTEHKVNIDATTVGHGNVDVKKVIQEAINGQNSH